LNIANQCEVNYRSSKNQRLQVELSLLKMCHIASAIQLGAEGLPALAELKKKLPNPGVSPAVANGSGPAAMEKTASQAAQTAAQPAAMPKPAPSTPVSKPAAASSNPVPATDTPKPAAKGWGNIKTSISVPNLNTIFDDKKAEGDDENELVEGNEFYEVTQNGFLSKWNEFAEILRNESKITLYTIMTSNAPVLEGTTIKVEVENMVQMEELKLGKIDMLNYLRVQLRNFSLDKIGR